MSGGVRDVGMSGVHWGLAGSIGTQGVKMGYRWHKGVLEASRGVGASRGH